MMRSYVNSLRIQVCNLCEILKYEEACVRGSKLYKVRKLDISLHEVYNWQELLAYLSSKVAHLWGGVTLG